MGKKASRTYRLSYEALQAIEERDLKKYPHANDFVEARLTESYGEKEKEDILGELRELRRELGHIKKFLLQKEEEGGGKNEMITEAPPLPDIFEGRL